MRALLPVVLGLFAHTLWLPALVLGQEEEDDSDDDLGNVIGIDLGTTYSCVAVYRHGKVEIITNDQGNRITPSYVSWDSAGARLVGDAAKNQATLNPKTTVFDTKRLIGREFSDESVQSDMKLLPYKIVNKNDQPFIRIKKDHTPAKDYAPEEIAAMVLDKMKAIAESYLGETVRNAVITVPAYFNDAQRQATKAAGKIAGLNVLRIFNEPTAAALAFGLNHEGEMNVIVYDLGGGTLDVTLLTIDNGVFEVQATSGNTHLGGEDFDMRVINYFVKRIKKKKGWDVSRDEGALQRLRREVERVKRELSSAKEATLEVESLYKGEDFREKLTRRRFEELNDDLFTASIDPMKKVLEDAEMTKADVHKVILVGGSTRIPKIRQLVQRFMGSANKHKVTHKAVNPDEAVATGAAVQGGILSGSVLEEGKDLLLLDVTPLSLGMEVIGELMDIVVPRNTPIPIKKTKTFTTELDRQTSLTNRVFEGERPMVKDNHKLAEFLLEGIAPQPRGSPQIEVTFSIDQNGILQVSAQDTGPAGSGSKHSVTVTGDQHRLSEEEMQRMMREAELNREADRRIVESTQARNELERFLYGVQNNADQMATPEVKDAVEEVLAWLEEEGGDADKEEVEEKLTALKNIVSENHNNAPPTDLDDEEDEEDEEDEGEGDDGEL